MGQRLNIEIIIDGKRQANAYYHWSAYTSSSLQIAQMIIDGSKEVGDGHPTVQAVKLLEITGAGLMEDEFEEMMKIAPLEKFEKAKNRNDGLISITEKGMENTRYWEEGRVEIDFDRGTVDFRVYYKYDGREYMEEREVEQEEYDDIPIVNYEYDEMSFKRFKEFSKHILDLVEADIYAVKTSSNEVVSFIE